MEIVFQFETLIQQIAENGYGVYPNFLSKREVDDLLKSFDTRLENNDFRDASISKSAEIRQEIRGDKIFWLEKESAFASEKRFFALISFLTDYLNQTCYLGIRSSEFHYALYPKGKFYKRHLDQFRNDSGRKLSVICYLNHNWVDKDGGQLRIYKRGSFIDILPHAGTLVVFQSDLLEHEVLKANKPRKSITGWLKNTPDIALF